MLSPFFFVFLAGLASCLPSSLFAVFRMLCRGSRTGRFPFGLGAGTNRTEVFKGRGGGGLSVLRCLLVVSPVRPGEAGPHGGRVDFLCLAVGSRACLFEEWSDRFGGFSDRPFEGAERSKRQTHVSLSGAFSGPAIRFVRYSPFYRKRFFVRSAFGGRPGCGGVSRVAFGAEKSGDRLGRVGPGCCPEQGVNSLRFRRCERSGKRIRHGCGSRTSVPVAMP